MLLGHQLVLSTFSEPELKKSSVKHVKGVHTTLCDKAIVSRLYYHFRFKGMRYDFALSTLSLEFYPCEATLAQIIMRGRDLLGGLKNENADRKYLFSLFSHYNLN